MSEVYARPGDALVISYGVPLSLETADRIKAQLAEQLPGIRVVILDQVTGLVVARTEESDGCIGCTGISHYEGCPKWVPSL